MRSAQDKKYDDLFIYVEISFYCTRVQLFHLSEITRESCDPRLGHLRQKFSEHQQQMPFMKLVMDSSRILTISRASDCLCVPVKASPRLKYNSVAVSSSVICLGTNTGSTYVFDRETFKLIKFISSKSGCVEILEFSKDGKLLAIADSSGIVTCLEIDEEKHSFKVVKEIEDHRGTKLTALCWDDDSARLFIGDERGVVTAVIVLPYKLAAGKFLSKSSVEIVIKGEAPIIQLDYSNVKLLVSMTTRTLLCLTDRSKYQQVGSKPRDGRFGSCFLHYIDCEFPVIYAARPGSRLWEVDFNGQVLATHQFKYLLAISPKVLYGNSPSFLQGSDHKWNTPQSTAFPFLQQLCNRYIVTWSGNGMYILDPSLGKVAGWYDQIKDIKDICCYGEAIYVLLSSGEVLEMEFLPVKECLKTLISMQEFHQAAKVTIESKEEILNHVESFLTIDFECILENIQADGDEKLHCSLRELIVELQSKHDQVRSEIQERLNRIASLDESANATPCDSGVEDNDDVRSNHSEIGSEASSRLSLTRLPHIDVDSVLRRATSAVVSKIVSSGFMKKALQEVLQADATHDPLQQQQPLKSSSHSQSKSPEVCQTEAASSSTFSSNSKSSQPEDKPIAKETVMGNLEGKSNDAAVFGDDLDGNMHFRSSTHIGRRRKKAKVVTVDFESPRKDDMLTHHQRSDGGDKTNIRRQLSLGATIPYSPHQDRKRLSSLPKPALFNEADQAVATRLGQQKSAENNHQKMPTIFKHAKQLVRNMMQHQSESLSSSRDLLDTQSDERHKHEASVTSFVLTSQEAVKHISKFVDVTAACRNKLRDSRILFNSKTVRKILQEWAEKLDETMKNFTKTFITEIKAKKGSKHKITNEEMEFLFVRLREEFFSSLSAAFSEVSNLASLCFETGIFPIACSRLSNLDFSIVDHTLTFDDIRKKVIASDALSTEDLHRFPVENTTDDELVGEKKSDSVSKVDDTASTSQEHIEISMEILTDERKKFLPENIESILCTSNDPITCQSCAEDVCRACFVLWYFPLLDIHKIRTVLSWKRGCRWRTWLAYLVHLEDVHSWKELNTAIAHDDYGKVARVVRDSANTESFFSCLRRIFSFSTHLVLDICTERDINPWEVSFIYMTNSENSDALGDFLGYISAMKRIKPSLNLYQDISVAMTALYCGLKQSAVSHSMNYCECDGARKGAHVLSWRWKNHIDDVIDWLLKTEGADSGLLHRVLKLCKEFGYWLGCIEIFRGKQDHKSSLKILCQLGDLHLLDTYIRKSSFEVTEDDLEFLFQLKTHKSDLDNCINCRPAVPDFTPNISDVSVAKILVRELGVKAALRLLEKFRHGECSLLGNFYYDCIKVAEKEMEQRFIATRILDKLSNEICDEKKSNIDKHIELIKNRELDGYFDVINESIDETDSINKLWDSATSIHWGVGLNLSSSNCPCCTLPLCIHGTSASSGLVVFECGHTFHKQCLPEEACLVCYYNLESFGVNS
eukprot:gene18250-20070_t